MAYDSLTEEQRFQLLQLIQERPILYDKDNDGYKNVTEKDLAWEDVAKRVRAQVNACKIAWKSMRDQYQRNMKLPKEKRKNFRYLSRMSFLNGKTKASRTSVSMDGFTSDYYYDNTSDIPKHDMEYDDSTDYGDYNETTIIEPAENIQKLDDDIAAKTITSNVENSEGKISIAISPPEEEYIYIKEGKEDVGECNIENMASTLFDTFNSLINKRFQPQEDDNDLFMKMLAKKMKPLPKLIRNRLQESFLEQVNYEITNYEVQKNKK
ncbi:uncharacterized protein [Musca autumnalis]|uniref:uncharacterized protein n=1 Tax=Musca autumnalis TaxID=221902 RepID=UPI003CF97322